jgi:mono/diheme cytochrome c family protein
MWRRFWPLAALLVLGTSAGEARAQTADAAALFDRHCAACHGIAGRDMTGRPTYPGMDFNVVKPSEAFVIQRMKEGVLPEDPEGLMPSFKGTLTDAQMRAVAAYVTATAGE